MTEVNRFPGIIRYAVQRIKLFCPTLGKAKIAGKLATSGIHIGTTTVQRILKEEPLHEPEPFSDDDAVCRERKENKKEKEQKAMSQKRAASLRPLFF